MIEELRPSQLTQLKRYAEGVLSAPAHLHLTSDLEPKRFWERHIEDALMINHLIPPLVKESVNRLLDVGSGNGIPGIPFAILNPNVQVTLLDSDNKKCGFLESILNLIELKNIDVLCGRAEALAHSDLRSKFDLVSARALGKLPVSLELVCGFAKKGGSIIVPHGTSWDKQWSSSQSTAESLGLELRETKQYLINRHPFFLSIFLKKEDTLPRFPRKFNQIKNSHL